jgi:hypothetical protein
MQTWPYFSSAESRHAMKNMSPVPVVQRASSSVFAAISIEKFEDVARLVNKRWSWLEYTDQPSDVLKLLDTNGGEYAAACSLDFSSPPDYYD